MYESDETMEGPLQMDTSETLAQVPTEEVQDALRSEGDGGDGGETTEATATPLGDASADPQAPAQSPDPAPQALEADPEPASELECLRRELSQLRSEMETQKRALDRMGAECAEFCELYPEQSPGDLPDEVWENVHRGIPMAAAFALYERRRTRIEEAAKLLNAENKSRSSGSVECSKGGYLSPDEVRAMTPAQVRANYQSILLSMQKWR